MVYESDFYTTRRPYSRPLVSSYSVTVRPIILPLSSIIQFFDDETREIRARVDSLLRRVHVFIPRAVASDFEEEIIPERMRSHDYVRRLLSGRNNAKKEIEHFNWYEVPERGSFGTLACVKYVAGKPQSVRKPYFKVADLRPADIRNDVNFLSYYSKNRQAAATASHGQPLTEREMRKARALGTAYTFQEEKTANNSVPELEQEAKNKSEKKLKKKPEPEEQLKPIYKPNLKLVEESISISELAKESETVVEPPPVKPLKSVKGSKSAKPVELKIESASEVDEAVKEPESINEIEFIKELEPVPEPEPTIISENVPKLDISTELSTKYALSEKVEGVSDEAKEKKTEIVRQEKEEAIRRAEEYLAKVAREALTEEEKRKAAEKECLQLEMEEKKTWEAMQLAQERKAELCQILENEQQEVERKTEEIKLEAERAEMERVAEKERIINQTRLTALKQEQERLIIEEHLEEIQQQKQEQEERTAEIIPLPVNKFKDAKYPEEPTIEEITNQEKEEKPYDVTTDDDTRIEEENVTEEEHLELIENPFAEEPDNKPKGTDNQQTEPITAENEVHIEEIISGGEFEWDNQDT